MDKYSYKTHGTCSREIDFEVAVLSGASLSLFAPNPISIHKNITNMGDRVALKVSNNL